MNNFIYDISQELNLVTLVKLQDILLMFVIGIRIEDIPLVDLSSDLQKGVFHELSHVAHGNFARNDEKK